MLSLALKAKNSSGLQTLFIDRADGEISFCLTGTYEGQEIQIDFEELSPEDVDDLILLLEHRRGLWCSSCRQEHEPCGQQDGCPAMSDTMLTGVLRAPAEPTDLIAMVQLIERAKQAADEIDSLRQQLNQAQADVARSSVDKDEWFLRGACVTLAMFDPKGTEYHEAVVQHGGYETLFEVAGEYDREHLLVAAEDNCGRDYAQRLRGEVSDD